MSSGTAALDVQAVEVLLGRRGRGLAVEAGDERPRQRPLGVARAHPAGGALAEQQRVQARIAASGTRIVLP